MADLAWHLTEVQHFWAAIADGLLQDPDSVPQLDRPGDDALPALFDRRSDFLVEALSRRNPEDECWSWHALGHSVGWIRRRQAHEALIHRVDAELAADRSFDVDPALAADGVDEVLRAMLDLDNLPEWALYEPDGSTATIEPDDGSASWPLNMGRFKGTSPTSGNTYNLPALMLLDALEDPKALLRGSAVDLDLWLWGRGSLDPITVEGDRAIADQLRATAADSTQ